MITAHDIFNKLAPEERRTLRDAFRQDPLWCDEPLCTWYEGRMVLYDLGTSLIAKYKGEPEKYKRHDNFKEVEALLRGKVAWVVLDRNRCAEDHIPFLVGKDELDYNLEDGTYTVNASQYDTLAQALQELLDYYKDEADSHRAAVARYDQKADALRDLIIVVEGL